MEDITLRNVRGARFQRCIRDKDGVVVDRLRFEPGQDVAVPRDKFEHVMDAIGNPLVVVGENGKLDRLMTDLAIEEIVGLKQKAKKPILPHQNEAIERLKSPKSEAKKSEPKKQNGSKTTTKKK